MRSIELSIRLLGSFAGMVLAGLGCVNWRIGGTVLEAYHDVVHSMTWRDTALRALGSPTTFAASIILAIAVIAAAWRLSLSRAAWLNFWLTLLNAALLITTVYFYLSLITFISETA